MITNHTQLLNYLIEKHSLKSYLEIGVRTTEQNFNRIKCIDKVGVDPVVDHPLVFKNVSDFYFQLAVPGGGTGRTFDLIFIDGLHHADQVKRDFENSLRCLNDNGFIVIHDTLPELEEQTCVPRGEQKQWWGDVYRFCMHLCEYDGIDFFTIDIDCGCTVIWKVANAKARDEYVENGSPWLDYKLWKDKLLTIIKATDLELYLPKVHEPTF